MPHWSHPFKHRRSTHILSYAVRQNFELLQTGGESCVLLKRLRRSNEVFQLSNRRVSTITKTASAGRFSTDPDTGMYRYKLWGAATDPVDEYPDIGTTTITVQSTGGIASVWEDAVDKYSFISDRDEYAFDIFQDQLDTDGNEIEDAMYVVFNTPPYALGNVVSFNFGNINPLVQFDTMQPVRDNQTGFQNSLFAYEQWIDSSSRIRTLTAKNQFLLAFPGTLQEINMTEGGFLRQANADYWTTPQPYSPIVQEHDVVVRTETSQRFQIVNYTPIYVEDILVSQHFDLAELDPKSSVFSVPYIIT